MADDPIPSTHRFIKGIKRASFTAQAQAEVPAAVPAPEELPAIQTVVVPVPPVEQPKKKGRAMRFVLWMLVGLLFVGLSVLSVQMYQQYRETTEKLAIVAPNILLEKDAKIIVQKVRRHMLLPEDEPKVNTITEVYKLKSEPFYANAINGDIVLVFPRRAILYRPIDDQIIEVGFIRQVDQAASFENTPTEEATSSGEPQVAGESTSSAKVLLNTEE